MSGLVSAFNQPGVVRRLTKYCAMKLFAPRNEVPQLHSTSANAGKSLG